MSEIIGGSTMADFSKFRSALNGFNRSDVANYIETSSAEHQRALQALQMQVDNLTGELEQAQAALDAQVSRNTELQKQLEETETALKSTEEALDEAMTMLTEEPEPVEEEEETPDYASMELEAYRRAEAMERASSERVAKVNQQLNDLLDQVSGRYEQTGQEIQVLTEDIRINLARLEEALSDLNVIFEETTQTFDTMDPAEVLVEE